MNILQLINHAGNGGSEKYVLRITESLLQAKHTVHFIYNEWGLLCEQMSVLGIIPVRVPMYSPFDIKAVRRIASYCEVNHIDVIHTHFMREDYIAILAKYFTNVRIVHTAHIIMENGRVTKFFNKMLTKKNHAVIAVCSAGKASLVANNWPEDKINIIYNGVAMPGETYGARIRRQFSIADDEFVFIYLGRFSDEKDPLFMLEGALQFKSSCQRKFRVLMVGDGPLLEDAKAFVSSSHLSDNVVFTGYRNDAPSLLAASNCYVNSSKNEALSFSIVEALSHSLPIIATNVGGNAEIINTSNAGMLIPSGDAKALADAMFKMMSDKAMYDACSKNALKAAQTHFNQENLMQKLFTLYGI